MDYKLKNCPFCGGKAGIKYVPIGGGYESSLYVKCNNCGATSQHLNITYREEELVNRIVDMWNKRI